jgi:hypothetical protein
LLKKMRGYGLALLDTRLPTEPKDRGLNHRVDKHFLKLKKELGRSNLKLRSLAKVKTLYEIDQARLSNICLI